MSALNPYLPAVAFLVYLVSHGLRSVRFWTIYGESKLSLRATFVIMCVTASLGYWIPVVFAEMIRFALFWYVGRDLARVVFTELLARSLDLIVLTVALGTVGTGALDGPMSVLVLFVAVSFIVFLFATEKLLTPLKRVIISRLHAPVYLRLLRALDLFSQVARSISEQALAMIALALTFTFLIWLLDVCAVLCMDEGHTLKDVVPVLEFWARHSFQSLLKPGAAGLNFSLEEVRGVLFVPQSIFSVGLCVAAAALTITKRRRHPDGTALATDSLR